MRVGVGDDGELRPDVPPVAQLCDGCPIDQAALTNSPGHRRVVDH